MLTLTFRTAIDLCPDFQKPSQPSKIPGYAPTYKEKVVDTFNIFL